MKLRLEVSSISSPGRQSYDFVAGPVNVGRSSSGHVVIEGTSVSRIHCILDTLHGAWHVTHNGSAAPTNLNGSPLPHGRPTRIAEGDRIGIAEFELRASFGRETEVPEIEPLRDSVVARMDMELPPPMFAAAPPPAPTPIAAPASPPPGLGANPGPAGRAVPTLVAYGGITESIRLELREIGRNYAIGRAATCDMSLPNNSVSRQHAFARFDGTRVYIRDAAARNPLRVNGRPIVGETPLTHGDIVSLGPVDLQFVSEPAAPAAPPPSMAPMTMAQQTMMMPKAGQDDRATMMPPRAAPEAPSPTVAASAWKPAAAAPAAEAPAWDAMAHQGAGNMPWAPAPPAPSFPETRGAHAPPPPPPPPPPVAPAASVADWAAMSARAEAKPAAQASWDVPAPPPPQAPPPPPAWDVPAAGGGGAVPWAGPPPVAPPPPAAAPPKFAPPPPAPKPFTPPPPPPPAAPGMAAGALKSEPKVVTRRSSSQKGWLMAGVICMIVSFTLGLIFVFIAAS